MARGNGECRAIDELYRLTNLQCACTYLLPLQILQNGYRTTRAIRNRTYPFDDNSMFILRTVREVETRDVHACSYELFELFLAIRCRPDGTYYLCATHRVL